MSTSRALAVASIGALCAVVAVIAIRLVAPVPGAPALSSDAVVPVLMAAAALCVLGLTIGRRPGVAWLAIVTALAIATVDVATTLRGLAGVIEPDRWRWLAVVLCLVAIGTVGAAVAFAAAPTRRMGRWLSTAGVLALAWMLGASAWALAGADPTTTIATPSPGTGGSLGTLGVVTRSMLVVVLGFVALGLIGDARAPAARAHRRLAVMRPAPASLAERVGHIAAFTRLFLDEVSPGRSRAHRAALDERSRIARDLHADVVPAIRRALAEAERDGSAARLAGSLREVLAEVDDLVATEHAIVLEVGGVVAAMEALAERVEERSAVRVAIDIAAAEGEPPGDVAAAALRIATLALDNVARHADGSTVSVGIVAATDRLTVVIEDDGPGLTSDARHAAIAGGRRGLADMAAEAAACGARLDVGPRIDDASGTRVAFAWPAA